MKIGVLGNKGGVGKTFVATQLAYEIAKRSKVLFIDTDYSQHSGLNWLLGRWTNEGKGKVYAGNKIYKVRDNLDCIWVGENRQDLERLKNYLKYDYPHFVIDGRPEVVVTGVVLECLRGEVVILPVDISDDTIFQVQQLSEAINESKIKVRQYVIVNKMSQARISQFLYSKIEKCGFVIIGLLPLTEWVKYAEARGKSVGELTRRVKMYDFFNMLAYWVISGRL
jgi:cellulose biosynthesis protein BcsQ